MKLPISTLLWRYFFMPLAIIAVCGALVIGLYGKANPPVTAAIWIACSIALGLVLLRGEALPGQHRNKEMQRREEALARATMAKKNPVD